MQMRELGVIAAPSAVAGKPQPRDRTAEGESLEFAPLYDEWFEHVARWIRALGAPSGDVEDIAQEVFLVVRRRLRDFDGRNLAGWLYRIASRQVRQRWTEGSAGGSPNSWRRTLAHTRGEGCTGDNLRLS